MLSHVDEALLAGETAAETAVRLAMQKAGKVRRPRPSEVIVGADTIVELEGKQLGKPTSAGDAWAMLRSLRGRTHQVVTGVALVGWRQTHQEAVATRVRMREYSDEEIESYVARRSPFDKAGGYAIQDVDFRPAAAIDGCYLNVVGLPLCEVARGLRALGWPLWAENDVSTCLWCALGQRALEAAT
jgi:MAF protein